MATTVVVANDDYLLLDGWHHKVSGTMAGACNATNSDYVLKANAAAFFEVKVQGQDINTNPLYRVKRSALTFNLDDVDIGTDIVYAAYIKFWITLIYYDSYNKCPIDFYVASPDWTEQVTGIYNDFNSTLAGSHTLPNGYSSAFPGTGTLMFLNHIGIDRITDVLNGNHDHFQVMMRHRWDTLATYSALVDKTVGFKFFSAYANNAEYGSGLVDVRPQLCIVHAPSTIYKPRMGWFN